MFQRVDIVALALSAAMVVAFGWIAIDEFFLQVDVSDVDRIWTNIPNIVDEFDWDGERPLNIAFMTWGSRGDTQPHIAFGLELGRRGHNVTIMAMEKYQPLIEQHEPLIHYMKLQDDYLWILADEFHKSEGSDFIMLSRDYAVNTSRQLIGQYMDLGRTSDVLVGAHACMTMFHHLTVAQALHKPLVFVTHDLTLPTAAYSFNPADSRVQDYGGRRGNAFNHRIFSVIFGAVLTLSPSAEFRKVRSELGLTTPWPMMELFSPRFLADFPVFYTADQTLWPPPLDRPPHWYPTGYFVTRNDKVKESKQDKELHKWIDARHQKPHGGRPILYFGQGSFDHHDRQVYTEILLDTCETLEWDAVALSSTVDFGSDDDVPNHIKVIDASDQERLFPICAVIAHHGGAGTSSQCIRSGRPGICMPSMPFQEVWGGQLQDYGAGVLLRPGEMLEAWKANRTNLLTESVRKAMDPSVQEKAAELGMLAREKTGGVELAADKMIQHIEALRVHAKLQPEDTPAAEL